MVKVLVGVGTLIFCFLILREFWWWYWGINRVVDALEDIAGSLRCLPAVKDQDKLSHRKPPRAA